MSFVAVAAVVSIGATAYGSYTQYQGAKEAEEAAEAQAEFEKATTEKRVAEEHDRTSQNLLRAQEEKRKELARQRSAFIKAGVLPDSPSARFVIGELGENLQTRIQDSFVSHQDRISSIQNTGSARHFNSLQNAKAAKRQQTGAIIQGISTVAQMGYKFSQNSGGSKSKGGKKS